MDDYLGMLVHNFFCLIVIIIVTLAVIVTVIHTLVIYTQQTRH